jgi:hypothetical protein
MMQQGIYGPVYFVDDNFIANRRAATCPKLAAPECGP